jgi:hypothetical protein
MGVKKFESIYSVILALILVLTSLPLTVSAQNEESSPNGDYADSITPLGKSGLGIAGIDTQSTNIHEFSCTPGKTYKVTFNGMGSLEFVYDGFSNRKGRPVSFHQKTISRTGEVTHRDSVETWPQWAWIDSSAKINGTRYYTFFEQDVKLAFSPATFNVEEVETEIPVDCEIDWNIVNTKPEIESINIVDQKVTFVFNKNFRREECVAANITVVDSNNEKVEINEVDSERIIDNTLTVTLLQPLSEDVGYTLTIPAQTIFDLYGNDFSGGSYTLKDNNDPPSNPELPLDGASEIVMNGINLYTMVIDEKNYDVYRIAGRIVYENGIFLLNENFKDSNGNTLVTDYLIDTATGQLVSDGRILQKAGYLHNYNLVNNPNNELIKDNIETIGAELEDNIDAYISQMTIYDDVIKKAEDIEYYKFIFDGITDALTLKSPMSILSLGYKLGKTIVIDQEINKEIPNKLPASEYIDALRLAWYAQTQSAFMYMYDYYYNYIPGYSDAFHNGYLASYEFAVNIESLKSSYEIYAKHHVIASKYLSYEIYRVDSGTLLDILIEAFGSFVKKLLPFLKDDRVTDFVFKKVLVGEIKDEIDEAALSDQESRLQVELGIDTTNDQDLINLEKDVKVLQDALRHKVYDIGYCTTLGNFELIAYTIQDVPVFLLDQAMLVKCPVDISVYDATGNLIGQVTDNVVVQQSGLFAENPLIITVEENAKFLYFPHDKGYKVNMLATDFGQMIYMEWQTNADGDTISETDIYDIPLTDGHVFTVTSPYDSISDPVVDGGDVPTVPIIPPYIDNGSSSSNSNDSIADNQVRNTNDIYWIDSGEAKILLKTAQDKGFLYARTRRITNTGIRKAALSSLAGLRYEHDTLLDKAVQVRLSIPNPAKATKDLLVSGHVTGTAVNKVKALFEKWYANKIRVIHLEQQGGWGQPVNISAKVDLTGMDTKNLYFYSYDQKSNVYKRITAPSYWIDANEYIHFTTEFAGDIVISENLLVKW